MHRPSQPGLRLARAGIGAIQLGIPVEAVVQAIPLQANPAVLPRRQGALYGVVEHRGTLVPVVDLARWVDVGAGAPARDARILVLREGGRTVGLRVDMVGGLVDVPPHLVTRLHHDDNPEDVFHTAARAPDDGSLLSLLEVGRLADLALAWSQVEPQAPAMPAAAAGPSTGTARTWALLRAGHARLAVAIGDLAEVIPMPALSRFGGGIDSAYCTWRGRHLLVLPAGVFYPQAPDAGAARLLAVIEHGGLALGFPVHEALQMAAFEGAGLPEPDGLGTILLDGDGTEVRLLDTARLFERYPEAALGKPEAAAGSARKPAESSGMRAANAVGYIVFDAGGMQAAPVGAVEQILPLASSGATMAWRDTTIALVDLRDRRAAPGDGAAGHVLVVRGAGGHTGFVVARVHSLIPPGTGTLYRMGGAAGQGIEFITTGEGAEQASYRTLDLAARADA